MHGAYQAMNKIARFSCSIALGLCFAGCPSTPTVTPTPTPKETSSAPSTTTATSAKPPDPAVDPALAKILAHGSIVGEPIHVAVDKGKPTLIAFVGGENAVSGAFSVVGDGDATPLDFPVGVRLVGTFHRDDPLGAGEYALVQSLAVLDQPSGRFGVVRLDVGGNGGSDEPGEGETRLVTYAHVTTVEAAKVAHPKNDAAQLAAQKAFLTKAATNDASLVAAFSAAGVDFYDAYQGVFLEIVEHLAPSPPKPRLAKLRELVATAAKAGACEDYVCEARDDAGIHRGAVALENVGGAWKISGFFGAAKKPSTSPAEKQGALVAASKSTTATEEAARARVAKLERVLGEAPYGGANGGSGTIGVALTDVGPAIVVRDGALVAVLPMTYFAMTNYTSPSDGPAPPAPTYEVAFADVDGDGFAEAILRRKSFSYPSPSPTVLTQVYTVPRTLVGTGSLVTSFDVDRQLVLLAAKTIDDAARAAVAYVAPRVTDAEACKVIGKLQTKAGLLSVTTPDALRIVFEEPSAAAFAREESIHPLRDTAPADLKELSMACKDLRCDGNGYCHSDVEGPYSIHYWFRREGKQVLVTGVAPYGGS